MISWSMATKLCGRAGARTCDLWTTDYKSAALPTALLGPANIIDIINEWK